MILTSKEIADAMGVTEQTVTQEWVKKHGLPVNSRGNKGQGKSHTFLFKDFVEWYHRNQSVGDELSPQDQLALARVEQIRIQNRITLEELVNKNEIIEEFYAKMKLLVTELEQLPPLLVEEIGDRYDIEVDGHIIRTAIRACLKKSHDEILEE